MSTTVKFNTDICTNSSTQTLYALACKGSSPTCTNKLQKFCNTQIHTNSEFNIQTNVLQCAIKCGSDINCKKQCIN